MRIDHRPLSVRVRQISLAVTAGPDVGARAVLAKRALTVGTDPSNDMVLTDAAVSRFHFRIVADDRGHRLIDSGSTNGTFVNGVRVERGYVADGVQITAGNTGFAVRFEQGPGAGFPRRGARAEDDQLVFGCEAHRGSPATASWRAVSQ